MKRSKEEVYLDAEENQKGVMSHLGIAGRTHDFVVYYDALSKDLEACLEKGRSRNDMNNEAKNDGWKLFSEVRLRGQYHLGKANVDVVSQSRKKE
ncbi:hypothetical protein Tco_0533701 [Tanacetum coccineum]